MNEVSAFDVCDKSVYPVIHYLLQNLTIQPASTASAERSFSFLRRLKQWMRSTISQEKLSELPSIAIHKDMIKPKDAEEDLNKFSQRKRKKSSVSLF